MIQRIQVSTIFDCTVTNVKNYRRGNLSDEEWNFQRNQQRNYETLIQCLSLRCQPLNINGPYVFSSEDNGDLYWTLTFETDKTDIFRQGDDSLALVKQDCNHVPMIVGLTESNKELFFTPYLITVGKSTNTFFSLV